MTEFVMIMLALIPLDVLLLPTPTPSASPRQVPGRTLTPRFLAPDS